MARARIIFATLAATVISGCTTVQAPDSSLGNVPKGAAVPNAQVSASNHQAEEVDMAVEAEVSKVCLEAWRAALAGNEKLAMSKLDKLGQQYPDVPTIFFMKGQVEDHLGKTAEAVKYYRQAITDKEFNAVHIYKLAEALRKEKKYDEAIIEYKRLMALAPEFAPGKLGMAKALLAKDKNSSEAKTNLEAVASSDTSMLDTKSIKEAKDLLAGMKTESH